MRSARLFLFDTVSRLWDDVLAGRTRHDRGSGPSAPGELACRHQRRAGGGSRLSHGWRDCALRELPLERAFRDVHALTQHIAVHPRTLETTGRVLFGLEPDMSALMV